MQGIDTLDFWELLRFQQRVIKNKKRSRFTYRNPLKLLARPARLEHATCGLEVHCSIQLSYGRMLPLHENLKCITTAPLLVKR